MKPHEVYEKVKEIEMHAKAIYALGIEVGNELPMKCASMDQQFIDIVHATNPIFENIRLIERPLIKNKW